MQEDGLLVLTPSDRGRPLTHRRGLDEIPEALRIDADVTIGPSSRAGLMCESEALDRTFTVGLLIGRFGADGWMEGARAAHGQPFWPDAHLAIASATTPNGGEHVAIWLDGALALEHVFDDAIGPYDSVVMSADTIDPPDALTYARVDIRGGAYAPPNEGGVTEELISDDFSDEGVWEAYAEDGHHIAYGDGALSTVLDDAGLSVWSWQEIEGTAGSAVVEASVTHEASGSAALMCGDSTLDEFFVDGLVGTGSAAIGRLADGTVDAIKFLVLNPAAKVRIGEPVRLTLGDLSLGGGVRIELQSNDRLVASTWLAGGLGPYDAAGLYGEGTDGPSGARFDDFAIRGAHE